MKIICLGDSFTEGFLVDKNYTDYLKARAITITNLGINGDMTRDMLDRFDPKVCDYLIVMGGTNDFYQNEPLENVVANIKKIIDKSKAKENIIIIPPHIEEEEVYPIYKMINDTIDDYAKEIEKIEAIIIDARAIKPSYIDGIHMREEFHKDLADEIFKVI